MGGEGDYLKQSRPIYTRTGQLVQVMFIHLPNQSVFSIDEDARYVSNVIEHILAGNAMTAYYMIHNN